MADMLVKLYNIPHSHDIEESLLKSGIRIKKALAPDRSTIIAFARTCAKDDYSDEVQAAFSNNPVTCYIATREKELIGFACYEATARNFFGPMAVLESERKKGVGRALLLVSAILFLRSELLLDLLLLVNGLFAILILWKADGYVFYQKESKKGHTVRQRKRASLWRYFFRYLSCHKNYLLNTAVMWCVALVLPCFLKEMAGLSVIPVGFAILSLNTPICILVSCDPDLEQAVRFLPGQKQRFCVPYCLFIFLCNMVADVIFLLSWQIQNGSITVLMIAGAVFFALQSAVLSVLLEWFYPIRGWKIESDLWHHPRKYVVPVVMFLLAGAVSSCPVLLPVPCVQAVITDLLKMFFGDMLYQPFDKIHCGHGFRNQLVIFVAVIMEGDIFTIIAVNTGSGYDRPAEMNEGLGELMRVCPLFYALTLRIRGKNIDL